MNKPFSVILIIIIMDFYFIYPAGQGFTTVGSSTRAASMSCTRISSDMCATGQLLFLKNTHARLTFWNIHN